MNPFETPTVEAGSRNEALLREMNDRLHAARIWRFDSYGWQDADTPDPEFVGFAMWQTAPAVDDLFMFNARQMIKPPPNPSAWAQLIAVSGADFEGLMNAARMSIGLLLVHGKPEKEFDFIADSFSDLHWMSSIIYLATSSERLREFFIVAAFRMDQAKYMGKKGDYDGATRKQFTTPFNEGFDLLALRDPKLIEPLTKLKSLAAEIETIRRRRNTLIHELATALGRDQRENLKISSRVKEPRSFDYATFMATVDERRKERDEKFKGGINQLSEWWELLVRAANEAFIFEHYRRNHQT
jgi:hypothetical protein